MYKYNHSKKLRIEKKIKILNILFIEIIDPDAKSYL